MAFKVLENFPSASLSSGKTYEDLTPEQLEARSIAKGKVESLLKKSEQTTAQAKSWKISPIILIGGILVIILISFLIKKKK